MDQRQVYLMKRKVILFCLFKVKTVLFKTKYKEYKYLGIYVFEVDYNYIIFPHVYEFYILVVHFNCPLCPEIEDFFVGN